jgi:hypothetical protein
VPDKIRMFRLYTSITWSISFFLTLFFFLRLFQVVRFSDGIFIYIALTTLVFWLGRYAVGFYYNFKYLNHQSVAKTIAYFVLLMLFTPIIEFLCTFPTWLSIARPPEGFEVTDK